MTEIWLKIEEVLGLTRGLAGWSERSVRRDARRRKLTTRKSDKTGLNGRRIREYSSLDLPEEIQLKLLKQRTASNHPSPSPRSEKTEIVAFRDAYAIKSSPRIVLPCSKAQSQAEHRLLIVNLLNEFADLGSEHERELWGALNGIQARNVKDLAKQLAEKEGCCWQTIFDWKKRLADGGFAALADRVRADKGQSRWFRSHHEAAIFAAYLFLSERQSVTFVSEQIEARAEQLAIAANDLPSRETVRLFLTQQISPAMKALAREGQREYRERMAPYLRRMYTDIFANQVWVGDTAILDIECQNDVFPELPDHAPLRLRITAFEDFRSRKFVGATFAVEGSSISITAALLRAVLKYGIPEMIYVDNGKDYKKVAKGASSGFEPVSEQDFQPLVDKGLLARLGIGVTHAIPRHPQSKHIERLFRTLHTRFDSVHSTYTSGSPGSRPDSTELAMMHHRRMIKKGRADLSHHPYASRIIAGCLGWIDEYNATPHSGEGMEGMSPNEVYATNLNPEQRPTPEWQQLAILMAEYKECTVDSCAVRLNRRRYVPRTEDRVAWATMHEMNERRVLVAFNPTDPEFAVALDLDGHAIAWLVVEQLARFAPNDPAVQRQIGESMEIRRGLEKATRQTLKVIEAAALANGAKTAEAMMYERLQSSENTSTAITHRRPRLAPPQGKKVAIPKTPTEVAAELLNEKVG